jgi:hypothetical protein
MEFMPVDQYGKKHPVTVGLEGVEVGKNYALIISTNVACGGTIRRYCSIYFDISVQGQSKRPAET